MSKKENQETEEIADAKGGTTAVATAQDTSVSTETAVQGVKLDFPFIRLAQGMSQWKTDGRKPVPGCFYLSRAKDKASLVAEGGRDAGIYGIVLQKVDGYKEERKFNPSDKTPPRRWIVGGTKEDGTPATDADCLADAAAQGFTLAPRDTGEVWPDSGRPIMRPNLGKFCYLCMLVPLPDDFDSDEYRVYPIGDRLYTTARYEFDKQYFKQMDQILGNIQSRAEFAHRREKDYRFSVSGLMVHLYSTEATSRSGVEYIAPVFEKAVRDGKPRELTQEEREDFVKFLMSVQAGSASINDVESDSEF